jgi:hypothetical protein
VSRPDDDGLRDRTIAYLRSGPARRLIRQRKAWVETVFGDGKERRGLRRARCRGLDAVRIQALMTATAQNIRKLALHRPPGPRASPASTPTASYHAPTSPCGTTSVRTCRLTRARRPARLSARRHLRPPCRGRARLHL